MTDFQIRSDNVDVEQIMRQIRSRIREKRGVDYTEDEIRELARVKLEKFLDPTGVRSDLLQQFRKAKAQQEAPPNFKFEDSTVYDTHRGFIRWLRKILNIPEIIGAPLGAERTAPSSELSPEMPPCPRRRR